MSSSDSRSSDLSCLAVRHEALVSHGNIRIRNTRSDVWKETLDVIIATHVYVHTPSNIW